MSETVKDSAITSNSEAMDARAAWRASGSPKLCPRCGGWDGPDLPFCLDGGHWTHDNTCAVYGFAGDLCASCERDTRTREESS